MLIVVVVTTTINIRKMQYPKEFLNKFCLSFMQIGNCEAKIKPVALIVTKDDIEIPNLTLEETRMLAKALCWDHFGFIRALNDDKEDFVIEKEDEIFCFCESPSKCTLSEKISLFPYHGTIRELEATETQTEFVWINVDSDFMWKCCNLLSLCSGYLEDLPGKRRSLQFSTNEHIHTKSDSEQVRVMSIYVRVIKFPL